MIELTSQMILSQYTAGEISTSGTLGHLTQEESQKLKELWQKILAHFEKTQDKPIPVSADFEMPVPLLDLCTKTTTATAGNASKSNGTTDAPADRAPHCAPQYAIAELNTKDTDKIRDTKNQTVGHALYLAGARTPPVPPAFKPLFSDDARSRLFRNMFWQHALAHSHPDVLALRFLRARKWSVRAAFDMLVATVEWRGARALDRLVYEGEYSQHAKSLRDGLCILHGTDRIGHPVAIIRVRHNAPRHRSDAAIQRYSAWCMDRTMTLIRARSDRATLVFDLGGFRLENVDLPFVRVLVHMLTNYYPETLQLIIIHVNSWLFAGLWKLIRPWIDPAVAAKIFFTKNANDLELFVARDQILAEMGGDDKSRYNYVAPTCDENARMFDLCGRERAEAELKVAVEAFEAVTRVWVGGGGDDERSQAASRFAAAADEYISFTCAKFFNERDAATSSSASVSAASLSSQSATQV